VKTPFAITLGVGSSLANRTGIWRVNRPVFVDRVAPCHEGCPAGENIQRWLYLASSEDYHGAWLEIVADNPFPSISGRLCDHPCESVCHRGRMDGAVGVHGIEAFLGDQAISEGWQLPDPPEVSGPRVLIVGSGPVGLAAAYHLRRLG
jgi:NADPH-dependent glutamate synthase beta subunit-like oxidoreductase